MPGIFVQTVSFGAVSTAVGLSEDLHKGLIERFRALPMARSAVLAGRTTADLARNVFVVFLMTVVGFAVGFRIGTNVGLFLCGALLVLAYSYASGGASPPSAFRPPTRDGTGHGVPDPVPVHLRLVGLRPRGLDARLAPGLRQEPTGHPGGRRLPLAHGRGPVHDTRAVWVALAWIFGLLIVLAPIAVRKYRRVV